jgi:hypothetical protein
MMRSARRRAVAAAVFLGTGAICACSSSPPPATSHGTLTVEVDPLGGTQVAQAYPDITDGSQVTVTDSSGKVIGTGTLSYDKTRTAVEAAVLAGMSGVSSEAALMQAYITVYDFTVTGLPGGESRYGFSIGTNRGTIWESPSQVKNPKLSLGSLSAS